MNARSEPGLPATPIAALPGELSEITQPLMEAFAQSLARAGRRVFGVVQTRVADEKNGKPRIVLREVTSGALYPISQDLGRGSIACNLDTHGLADACAQIENAARAGADLIVISKFSKQEAARGGLCDAFKAAMSARVPVIAAVSPHYLEEWAAFAGPLAEFVEPSREALEEWWRRASSRSPLAGKE